MSKQTVLYDAHVQLNAKMIDFNGWMMPVQYKTGILAEHKAVREKAGIFDTCHMGEFTVKSDNVRKTLNQILTGDFSNVKNGRMRYTFITAEDGTVIDDAVVFVISDTEAMICVNAGDIDGDFEFIKANLPEDATTENRSDCTGKIDIQGPNAHIIVKELTGHDLRNMPFYSFITIEWQGENVLLSRSGYTGSQGVEIFLPDTLTEQAWNEALELGAQHGLIACGLGARDTLRLEAGLPLYGHELDRNSNPLQAGFARFVSVDKEENFPGKSALSNFNTENSLTLCGLKMSGRRVPRHGFVIKSAEETEIGTVTSGGPAPTYGGNIALAYLKPEYAKTGCEVFVDIRSKPETATVTELPFYKCEDLRKKS